jgi:hypothetical protein
MIRHVILLYIIDIMFDADSKRRRYPLFKCFYDLSSRSKYRGDDKSLARPGRKKLQRQKIWCSYILFIIRTGGIYIYIYFIYIIYIYMYKTRLASNEIFSPSNKIHREVGRAKDLSAHL